MGENEEEIRWWIDEKWVMERVEEKIGNENYYSYKYECPVCGSRPYVNATPEKWEIHVRCKNCDTSTYISERCLDRKDL